MKTDSQIQQDVMDELKWAPFLNASQIGVAVKNGVVTLSGTVDMYSKKTAAENVAKKVSGVLAVAEDIEVHLPGSSKRNDAEIAEAVLNALKWHSALREDRLKVKVENGVVTLDGDVEWEFQRNSARLVVEPLTGVLGVINNIRISHKATSGEVKNEIKAAFQRQASLDAGRIEVQIEGNTAVLSGKVRSWAEKKDAERTAWFAKGIEKVKNNLVIDSDILVY